MAVMAKALNKPFYVVAESFKFVRMFPLNQDDLPNKEKVSESRSKLVCVQMVSAYCAEKLKTHKRSP